jgi:signal transduction histidine kinase
LSQRDPSKVTTILQELSEPLAAILSNAQAGHRMLTAGVDAELIEVLSDIAEDGKRAGELLGRLNELSEGD